MHSFEFHIIEEDEVRKDIEALDSDSSNDVLKLYCKLLKLSASLICTSLTHLFNLSLLSRIIPTDWKLARITPIYKGKGDTSEKCNYRPISALSYVAKLFEKQVHFQLLHYLELHSFITLYQSAYLKKHSTVTCLHRVIDDLCENIDDDLLCGVCFLDIEKCFDSINHDILRRKLAHYGVNGGTARLNSRAVIVSIICKWIPTTCPKWKLQYFCWWYNHIFFRIQCTWSNDSFTRSSWFCYSLVNQ